MCLAVLLFLIIYTLQMENNITIKIKVSSSSKCLITTFFVACVSSIIIVYLIYLNEYSTNVTNIMHDGTLDVKDEIQVYNGIQFRKRLHVNLASKAIQPEPWKPWKKSPMRGSGYHIVKMNNLSLGIKIASDGLSSVLSEDKTHGTCQHCTPLVYISPPGPTTALASVPGSGNTWVRHLLQQATGKYLTLTFK